MCVAPAEHHEKARVAEGGKNKGVAVAVWSVVLFHHRTNVINLALNMTGEMTAATKRKEKKNRDKPSVYNLIYLENVPPSFEIYLVW